MGFIKLLNMADKRELKGFEKIADQIDAMEPKFEAMTNKELKSMTNTFKDRLAKGETLDDILPEAFATVHERSFKKSFRYETLQSTTYRGDGFTSR